ncbi:1670_t:CDS:2 [Funneliformis caledonium]|uniref:1670_t:CDS:1 n=1 Tax=Funneliformis caledonium TaxID=1117310 RepID=A0A9N9G0Z6_9GLOM|nr:1670_t:CDS:2 [Funneliformis caledonium]
MKCSNCKIDKLSREFPNDIISQNCFHISTFCLKCIINIINTKDAQKQCPECKSNISAKELENLNILWEKAPFRINIENISELHSQKISQNGEVDGHGNATAGDFYVVLLNGTKLKFRLETIKTVGALKEAIKGQTKIETNKQKLIHKGVELQTYANQGRIQNQLSEYHIVSESHIQLIVLLYSISKELSISALTFDLFWGYPSSGCDYLDGTCLLYTGTGNNAGQLWRRFDYQSTSFHDIPNMSHSGDIMDHAERRGHHRITANLASLPPTVSKLYFILSSWNSPNIGHFPNPSFKMFDPSKPNIQLCSYTIQSAASSQAVIMCVAARNSFEGNWNVFEIGKLSAGNAKNYTPIEDTISNMDKFFGI